MEGVKFRSNYILATAITVAEIRVLANRQTYGQESDSIKVPCFPFEVHTIKMDIVYIISNLRKLRHVSDFY